MDWRPPGEREFPGFGEPGFSTDARPADESPRRQRDDPDAGRRLRFRRRVIGLVFGALLVAGTIAAAAGKGGYLELRRLKRDNARLAAEVAETRFRVARLRAEVGGLESDSLYRERIARELGLARPGEVEFLLPRAGLEWRGHAAERP